MSSVRQRTASALVAAPAFLAALHAGGWVLLGTGLFTAGVGQWELGRLFAARSVKVFLPGALLGGAVLLVSSYLWGDGRLPVALAVALAAALATAPLAGGPLWQAMVGQASLLAYVSLPLSYLLLMRRLPRGELATLLGVAAVWGSDTVAFFVGRAIGRRPLAPLISPRKTVEGAVGGLVGALVIALLAVPWLKAPVPTALGLGLVAGIFGQAGDLLESALKRWAGVKDSGQVLPGHGGLLDRIDSVLLALPALYYYVRGTLKL